MPRVSGPAGSVDEATYVHPSEARSTASTDTTRATSSESPVR
jgi:hypothetical protein